MVSQDVPLVQLWRRRTAWEREMYRADDTFRRESVELNVPVQHIYRRVRKEVGLDVVLDGVEVVVRQVLTCNHRITSDYGNKS